MDTIAFAEARKARGLEIARSAKIVKMTDRFWAVPSQQNKGKYAVDPEAGTCMCPDFETHHAPCKHLYAVRYARHQITTPDGTTIVTDAIKITYAQNWPAYNPASCSLKKTARVLLRDLCSGIEQPRYKGNGRPALPWSDVVFAMTWKVFNDCSARDATTDVEDCREKGLIEVQPHYNTLLRFFDKPELTPVLKCLITESASPLASVETQFAVDATGFGSTTYAHWFDHKWGKDRRHQKWVKCHAMIGTKTNVVIAAEVTEGTKGDSPEFIGLLNAGASRFNVREVSADKAYLSSENVEAIERVGALPFIPPKLNSNPTGGGEAWKRMFHYFQTQRDDFMARYHRRSNVETTFHQIKKRFGTSVSARKERAQFNEVLAKLICHNLSCLVHEIHELGIEPKFWIAQGFEPSERPIDLW